MLMCLQIAGCGTNNVDRDKTVISRHVIWHLIWVYTVASACVFSEKVLYLVSVLQCYIKLQDGQSDLK